MPLKVAVQMDPIENIDIKAIPPLPYCLKHNPAIMISFTIHLTALRCVIVKCLQQATL